MGDKESKKEKKNNVPMGKTMRRKKKKGPTAAVKIPSGYYDNVFTIYNIDYVLI